MAEATTIHELAFRTNDGLDVSLLWHSADDRVSVVVTDHKAGESFELGARRDNALEVFYHPFVYAVAEAA